MAAPAEWQPRFATMRRNQYRRNKRGNLTDEDDGGVLTKRQPSCRIDEFVADLGQPHDDEVDRHELKTYIPTCINTKISG